LEDSGTIEVGGNMSTTIEERTTCSCGRPAVYDPLSGETRYCEEHKRVVFADEVYGDWLEAHEAMREALGPAIDDEDDSPLNEIARTAMDEIKRQCAHWRGELEIADWIAKRGPEGFSVRGRRLSPEEAEVGGRHLRRSDHLHDAIDVVYKAPGIDESERWAMLSALYEVKEQVDGELERFRTGIPPA
jgi:hypothetical protein